MKRFYVTKKQVAKYIERNLSYFGTIEEFAISVDALLDYLECKPEVDENPSTGLDTAQIKFYNRVSAKLESLRAKATTP